MELNEVVADVMQEITKDAVQAFHRAIERGDLVLTQDLYNSFETHITQSAQRISSEIEFRVYGRYKDMREIKYIANQPPLDAMKFFVEKIGVENFSYVPGYQGTSSVPTQTAINRIAFAIAKHYTRVPSVRRGYRGNWYNSTVMLMVNNAKKQLRWRASEWIAWKVKQSLES